MDFIKAGYLRDKVLVPVIVFIKNHLFRFILLLLVAEGAWAEQAIQNITVIMPQVRPPFDRVFAEIYSAIQREAGSRVSRITIDEDTTSEQLHEILGAQPPNSVIGLGNRAKTLLKSLESQYRIVYGAVYLNPDEEPKAMEGISLTPSPDATFKWLHSIVPEIKSVHVVYQQNYSGWLIALADKAAPNHALRLIKHPVANVREAAAEFRNILDSSNPASEAIWLMQRDPSLDEKAVVPDILAQAWNKNLVVFSSNPAHVARGALFALYPDNGKMGRSLAQLALDKSKQGIEPLEDLLIAVNTRTASHIGKGFARSEEKQFDLIFPNR